MLLLLLDGDSAGALPLPVEYIGDHVAASENLLLEQFKNSTSLKSLLQSWTTQVQEAEDLMAPLVLARNIDTATGTTLDSLGEAVGLDRSGRSDETYRLFIRAKVLINRSSGTANELIAIARQLAGDPDLTVLIDEYNPATFFMRLINYQLVDDPALWGALLRLAKAAGVRFQLVYSTQPDEDLVFRFSSTTSAQFGTGYGFDGGQLTGAA